MASVKCYRTTTVRESVIFTLSGQHLERMSPLVFQESRDEPEHAQRLDRARCDDSTAIDRLPTELANDLGDLCLRAVVITAQKHTGCSLFKMWIHHEGASDAVECFHHVSLGNQRLNFF